MKSWLRAFFQWRKPAAVLQTIEVDGAGLQVQRTDSRGVNTRCVRWEDVKLIAAYKRDVFAYDQVCVELILKNPPGVLIVEEDAGFSCLVADLHKHVPEVPEDWYLSLIATPAFDETLHVLLNRM